MIVAVSMFRDEADVAATVIRHLFAEGVDRMIVADNRSTDGTSDILADLADDLPLEVVDDPEVGYYQAAKMTKLARRACDLGADWVLPFDADEVWYAPAGTVADALADTPHEIVMAGGFDHIVRSPGDGPFSPWRRQRQQQLAKVAFRAHPSATLHMGNHGVERPGRSIVGPLEFRHFQYRSEDQMIRKLRNGREAYEASDVHPNHGTHWREGGAKSDDELACDWAGLCAEDDLIFDPAPIRR